MRPQVVITVDGHAMAGGFYERLVSVSVSDKEGVSSDTFEMTLDDGPPNFLAIPRTGARVEIQIGYAGGLVSLGSFVVDKVQGKCLPFSMSVSGKSADLRRGKLKENKERHWDEKTVKEIVEQVASENGLSASVGEEAGAHTYSWLGQQDESDIAFLERLARRHNALFSIKAGKLVFADRGSGMTASGGSMGRVVVTPPIIVKDTCTFEANDRTKYQKVVAYYQDRDQAKRVEVEAELDAESDSVFRLPEPYADAAEADKAAQAKAKQLKRGEGAASVTVVGDPTIVAGAPLVFSGVRPGLDGVPYVIDTATHSYSKGEGYRTAISAKLYDGKSAKSAKKKAGAGAGASGKGSASATAGKDTPAPNAPAGTPAAPSEWTGQRSYGSTDAN